MDKKIFREMRDQLSPDESVTQSVLRKAELTVLKEDNKMDDKKNTAYVGNRWSKIAAAAACAVLAVGATAMVIKNAGKVPADDSARDIVPSTQVSQPEDDSAKDSIPGIQVWTRPDDISREAPDFYAKGEDIVRDIEFGSEKRLYVIRRSQNTVDVTFTATLPEGDSYPDKVELWDTALKTKIADLTAEDTSSFGTRVFTGTVTLDAHCNAEEFDRNYYSLERRNFMAVYTSGGVNHLSKTEQEVVIGFVSDNAEEPLEQHIPYSAIDNINSNTVEDLRFWMDSDYFYSTEKKGSAEIVMHAQLEKDDGLQPEKMEVTNSYSNEVACYLYDSGDMEKDGDAVKGDGIYSGRCQYQFDFDNPGAYDFTENERFTTFDASCTTLDGKDHYSINDGFTVYYVDKEKEFGALQAFAAKCKEYKATDDYKNADIEGRRSLMRSMLIDLSLKGTEDYPFSFLKMDSVCENEDTLSFKFMDKFTVFIRVGDDTGTRSNLTY